MVTATPRIHQLFESDPRSVRRARRFVIETLRLNDATEASCEAFALIASELITNFVEHGVGSPIDVSIGATSTRLDLSVAGASNVTPNNPVLHPELWAIAPPGEITGRGLGIVRALCDDLTVTTSDKSLEVHCRMPRAADCLSSKFQTSSPLARLPPCNLALCWSTLGGSTELNRSQRSRRPRSCSSSSPSA